MAAETAGEREWWTKPAPLHLGLWSLAVLAVLVFGNPLETQERQLFDRALRWRFAAGYAPPVDRSIVHLNIDAEDLRQLPNLEAEYAAAARIVREASALGVTLVAFDIIFARGDATAAAPLIEAIAAQRNVVLAEAFAVAPGANDPSLRLHSFPFREENLDPAGVINLSADADGVIREYQLVHKTPAGFAPSFALAVHLASLGLDWKKDVSVQPEKGRAEWPELSSTDYSSLARRHLPLHPVLVNLRCPWSVETGPAAFEYLNLRQLDVLFAKTSADAGFRPLRNKILVVGYVATGQGDLGPTAFGRHEPLIYLHSAALNDLRQRRWLQRTGRLADALWLCSALLVLAGAFFCRSKWTLVLWWFAGLAGVAIAAGLFVLRLDLVAPAVATAALWTLASVAEIARRHSHELNQRKRLRDTMQLYFSPRVLNDVLKNPGRLEPKRVEITTLLTDLRNSTDLAELLGTEKMLALLNQIFAIENAAVFAEDGSLEKPVGDQFLAYWGAPDPQPDAADRALRAALTLIDGLEKLRTRLDPAVQELFGYGVALHAGSSLIANIGSPQFFHYGVVGDLINATARVESLTKYYGVVVLATRAAYERLKQPPEARVIDHVVVKGKTAALELIEVRHPCSVANFSEVAEKYAEAFSLYRKGSFGEAEPLFRSLTPIDKPSGVLAQRCSELARRQPSDWDGIFALTSK